MTTHKDYAHIILHDTFYYPAAFGLRILRVNREAWDRVEEGFSCCGVDVLGNVHEYVHNDEYDVWKMCGDVEVIQAFEVAFEAIARLRKVLRDNGMMPPADTSHYINPNTVCEETEATDDDSE